MKQFIKNLSLVLLIALLAANGTLKAQTNRTQKPDKVVFLNGSIKEGKVSAFLDQKIQFTYQGETLNYLFDKKEIERIEYASGRIEELSKKAEQVAAGPFVTKNKVAVLPMGYIGEGTDERTEDMRFRLQEIAVNYLSKSATELKFMDPAEINAHLLRNGITHHTIREYSPRELAEALHVEYVIMGSVLQDKGAIVTVNHNTAHRKKDIDNRGHGDKKVRSRSNVFGSSVTRQHIETNVSLSIYNETGERIYAKSRNSILNDADAYKYAIEYLLKRTPLYKR